MQITKENLNTGPAPERYAADGSVNVILVLHDPSKYYVETNTYLPAWGVSNTVWYNAHQSDYLGWVDLEDIDKPKF